MLKFKSSQCEDTLLPAFSSSVFVECVFVCVCVCVCGYVCVCVWLLGYITLTQTETELLSLWRPLAHLFPAFLEWTRYIPNVPCYITWCVCVCACVSVCVCGLIYVICVCVCVCSCLFHCVCVLWV